MYRPVRTALLTGHSGAAAGLSSSANGPWQGPWTAQPSIRALRLASALITAVVLFGCGGQLTATSDGIHVEPFADYQADADCAAKIRAIREEKSPTMPLHERYRLLRVIDVHNHGAAGDPLSTIELQEKYSVDCTVLFGDISEPSAADTDQKAFSTYCQYPDKVYPFFAGIPLRDKKGIAAAVANLERGYFGVGEIVGASTRSPVTSRLPWKAQHPNDGILPEIYRLSAKYHVPVLLHIDPPVGEPIQKLEEALSENPHALIIFGHANAYNTPANIEHLVSKHPNLYIDFYAGFTAYNPDSANAPADFVPVIEKYPNQFMVSTDSGYGIGQEEAIQAIYELLDLLTPETACKVAHQNMDRIIESQPPTETQIAQIESLSRQAGERGTRKLNKRMANELIFELQDKLKTSSQLQNRRRPADLAQSSGQKVPVSSLTNGGNMMTDSAIDVVRAFVAAINGHDCNEIAELMTDDHTFVDSGGTVQSGRETMTAIWKEYFRMFPDYEIQVERILQDGALVAVFGSASGTYNGKRGLVPENRIAAPAAWKAVVENGKIKLWRVYTDWTEGSKTIEEDNRSD